VSPRAQIATIPEHFYNLGLLDLQERVRAQQISLLLEYLIRHNQTSTAYSKYQQLLKFLAGAGGLELLDYYNDPHHEDPVILDQFMNELQVREAFGISR